MGGGVFMNPASPTEFVDREYRNSLQIGRMVALIRIKGAIRQRGLELRLCGISGKDLGSDSYSPNIS